ncbi:MAG: amidohydrolase family protein [Acidimicrobiia bacterium]|nr:amidohydrolase family protein [Acidimicrobiia bacterium]MDH5236347.1 amidohydrolase family protein [Acidimicrobiia bacterium]
MTFSARRFAAIDTMIGLRDVEGVDRALPHVADHLKGDRHPADYMYKDIPPLALAEADVVADTLAAMDANGVAVGLLTLTHPASAAAARTHPDRFVLASHVDAGDPVGAIRQIRAARRDLGIRAVSMFPPGTHPAIAVDDPRCYAVYAACAELGLPLFVTAGVPGPRVPFAPQHVELLDRVCYDFPDLSIVMRHGAEPWADLAVKLLLKWPNLYYSTSAFSPRYYPASIIEYANTRGADKVLYGGYYPYALELDRIFDELDEVPFRPAVWPRFLRDNAARLLGLD